MTVRVERTFELPVPPACVWEFIADPANRARAISVVDDYELHDDEGSRVTWHVELPIPLIGRTTAVETRDVERDPPRYVRFVGESKFVHVTGEHEITETADGCRMDNRFVVDGRVPGVERFFERQLDDELTNLRRHAEDHLRAKSATEGECDAD